MRGAQRAAYTDTTFSKNCILNESVSQLNCFFVLYLWSGGRGGVNFFAPSVRA